MDKKITFKEFLKNESDREEILGSNSKLSDVLKSAMTKNDINLSNSTIKEIEGRVHKLSLIDETTFPYLKNAIGQLTIDSSMFAKSIDTSALTAFTKTIDTSALTAFTKSIDTSALTAFTKSIDTSALTAFTKTIDTSALTAFAKPIDTYSLTKAIKPTDALAFTTLVKPLDTSAFKLVAESYESLLNSISPISKIYSYELEKIKSNIDKLGIGDILKSEVFIEAKKIQAELVKFEPHIGLWPITTFEKSIEAGNVEGLDTAAKEVLIIEKVEQLHVRSADIPLLDENPIEKTPVDILIVTGLPFEVNVFREIFNVKGRWQSDKYFTEYFFGSIESDSKEYSIALTFGFDMGNFYASQVTNAAIEDLNPKIVISAGIGYTLNPHKLKLCDLHVTNSVVYWGLTSKEYEGSGRKVRTTPVSVKSSHLFQEVRNYSAGLRNGKTSFSAWQAASKCDQPEISINKVQEVLKKIDKATKCGISAKIFNEYPHVEIGRTMVSDDAVIASIIEIKRRSLSAAGNESQISGDMEAAGVAMALSMRKSPIEFFAIRGISDFGFGKEALESSSDKFRLIAATRAATFIRSFLESDPTLPKSASGVVSELGSKKK